MGAIQLSDELQRVIERQVANGRAATPAAFLEEAVRRLVEEARDEAHAVAEAVAVGSADIKAGRYVAVATQEDEQRLHDGLMARLRARVSTDR